LLQGRRQRPLLLLSFIIIAVHLACAVVSATYPH